MWKEEKKEPGGKTIYERGKAVHEKHLQTQTCGKSTPKNVAALHSIRHGFVFFSEENRQMCVNWNKESWIMFLQVVRQNFEQCRCLINLTSWRTDLAIKRVRQNIQTEPLTFSYFRSPSLSLINYQIEERCCVIFLRCFAINNSWIISDSWS